MAMNLGFGVITAETLMHEPPDYGWKRKCAHDMQPDSGINPESGGML